MGRKKRRRKQEQRELLGEKVQYIGVGVKFECEQCSLSRGKGMISVYKNKRFCSEQCVEAYVKYEEGS